MKRVIIGIVIGAAIALAVIFLMSPERAPSRLVPDTAQATKTHVHVDGRVVVRGNGEPVELLNNADAVNPTYAELLAFLERDQTDEYTYMLGPPKNAFICTDFAETVHNNAEDAGIRAGFVAIYIEGMGEGHALNAFQTTDRGLVFIDCTGQGLWSDPAVRTRWNRRAFVEAGQPYMVSFLDAYDHHHSAFDFVTYVGYTADQISGVEFEDQTLRTLEELGWLRLTTYQERSQRTQQLLEWLRIHDLRETNRTWTEQWIRDNEGHMYKWTWASDGSSARSFFGSESHYTGWTSCIRADVVQGSWFEPPIWSGTIQEKVRVIGDVPVVWQISWRETAWREPFRTYYRGDLVSRGIVEAVHIDWGG